MESKTYRSCCVDRKPYLFLDERKESLGKASALIWVALPHGLCFIRRRKSNGLSLGRKRGQIHGYYY